MLLSEPLQPLEARQPSASIYPDRARSAARRGLCLPPAANTAETINSGLEAVGGLEVAGEGADDGKWLAGFQGKRSILSSLRKHSGSGLGRDFDSGVIKGSRDVLYSFRCGSAFPSSGERNLRISRFQNNRPFDWFLAFRTQADHQQILGGSHVCPHNDRLFSFHETSDSCGIIKTLADLVGGSLKGGNRYSYMGKHYGICLVMG